MYVHSTYGDLIVTGTSTTVLSSRYAQPHFITFTNSIYVREVPSFLF